MYKKALSVIFAFVAAAEFTACLSVLLRVMLEVAQQGGFCARGGAYVIANECSDQAAYLPPLMILGLIIFVVIGALARGAGYLVAIFAWPAIFITLGGGFIYSARYPEYGDGAAYAVGGVFLLMGGLPVLLVAVLLIRKLIRTLVQSRRTRAHSSAYAASNDHLTGPFRESKSSMRSLPIRPVINLLSNVALLGGALAAGLHIANLVVGG